MLGEAGGPHFDMDSFNRRWKSARLSAFPEFFPEKTPTAPTGTAPASRLPPPIESEMVEHFFSSRQDKAEEPAAREKRKDTFFRDVFQNSRKLGLSLSKHLGLTFEIQDFQDLMQGSGIPCVQGQWSMRENARVLNRKGCDFCLGAGSHACDYWLEALDGLIMGLGEKERIARHASVRHGDATCIDVLYTESVPGRNEGLAWGPVPEHMALDLFETAEYFQRQTGIAVDLKGMKEGVLYFEFKTSTDGSCGTGGLSTRKFQDMLADRFPGLSLKDVTPQAVLGEQAG